jgi:HK97 family phage major capsid protein/HK97 family phage prohead protease
MDRAYAFLEVKNLEEEQREIFGVATTPTPDRVGDIVNPMGVKYTNPMPLLHGHKKDQPVGTVTFGTPTKKGITFQARLPKIDEPGPLKDRVDTAWGEVKAGLVRAVSIGFRALETELTEDGGLHFVKSEVLELSLVPVPANAECTISMIKSLDRETLAASGHKPTEPLPASREKSIKKPEIKEKKMTQTTAEKISAFEASRQAKSARMEAIMEECGDETLDVSAEEEYDTLKSEVKKIDSHLDRLNDLKKVQLQKAVEVKGSSVELGSDSRGEGVRISVKQPELPKGIAFARYAKCKALGAMNFRDPADIAMKLYPQHEDLHMVLKTDIPAGNTQTVAWAGALVGSEGKVFADFVEFLRPMTIIGQFGNGGIPSFRRVPFRTPLIANTTGLTGYWVGEGQAKPLSKGVFSRTTLLPYKVAALTALTMEVLRDSSPSAETIIRDELARAVAAKLDTDFLDPQKGLEANVSPASISNGLTPIQSVGRDADSVRADIVSVISAYIAANNPASSAVWVMSAVSALQLSLMTNALGQSEFPEISARGGPGFAGGTLRGFPIITSEYLGYTTDSPTEGRDVFLVNANDIYFGDDGGVDVRMSTEASLEMEDGPANASATTVSGQSLVSMFQTNTVAFLAERSVGWARRRTEGVIHLRQVEWGESSDSAVQP